jgi:3-oxoacyl-[acyl-carrier protein] reductase/(S)-1-phenylethanol dehydrogenase
LRAAGQRVAVLDLRDPAGPGEGVVAVRADLADPDAVESAVAEIRRRLGAPSVIVHCAAFQYVAPFDALDPADWTRTFRINVDGAFRLLRATLVDLRAEGSGRIVLITSSSYYAAPAGMSHYIASKGALTGLVRGLATELGPAGITVNAVAPGLARTENAVRNIPEEHFALVLGRQAIGRSDEADDVAAAVAFLASEDAAFITGQTLLVDGGESRI